METDQGFKVVTLVVMNADDTKKNTVTCEIIVDGRSVEKQPGSGTSAMATCSYSLF